MAEINRCVRCEGSVVRERTLEGMAYRCLSCGHEAKQARIVRVDSEPSPARVAVAVAPAPVERRVEEGKPVVNSVGTGANGLARSPQNGVAPTTRRSVSPDDWLEAARGRLAELVEEIAEVDAKRDEAQRIHAALTAFGAADLAPLPWKPVKAKPAGA